MKYSINPKLNAVLNAIEERLLQIADTREESLEEVKHYMEGYPMETDYSLYQSGTTLFYTSDIRQLYIDAGYKAKDWSYDKLIDTYKRQIGYVAREITK